ncbi:hypothetical protein MRX96_044045 [Rhipicephalus microplus]
MVVAAGGETPLQDLGGGFQGVMSIVEKLPVDETMIVEREAGLEGAPSRESLSRETRITKKKAKRRKGERVRAEDTEITSTGAKDKKARKHVEEEKENKNR